MMYICFFLSLCPVLTYSSNTWASIAWEWRVRGENEWLEGRKYMEKLNSALSQTLLVELYLGDMTELYRQDNLC